MANMAQSTYAVDRIESNTVICECLQTGKSIAIDKKHLPFNVKEGDILLKNDEGFVLDKAQTQQRRERLTTRMNKLFRKKE